MQMRAALDKQTTSSPQRVKLVHITTAPPALWAFFRGQIGYMSARGLEVEAVSSPGAKLQRFADREAIPVHAVAMPRSVTPLRDVVAMAELWWLLRRLCPQILHAHTPKGGLLGMICGWLARVPVRIYRIAGLPLLTATGYKATLLRWSEKVACRLSHQVLCVSPSIREIAIEKGLCPAGKIKVLLNGSSNGVDAQGRFNPARTGRQRSLQLRREWGIPEEAPVIGFAGRLVRDKGITELVEAWQALRGKYPQLHLLVIGDWEPQDPVPEAARAALEADERVKLTGEIDNIEEAYTIMDILALPTYREGLPNVPLEAAAMQLPVVASAVPGCVDAVADGVTGTLVPVRDAAALTAALQRYLDDPELRRRHGQAGRERVLRDFCPEELWAALYGEYERLLHEKGMRMPARRAGCNAQGNEAD